MSQEAVIELPRRRRYWVPARNFQRELNQAFYNVSPSSSRSHSMVSLNLTPNSADGEQNNINPWREVEGSFENAVVENGENQPKGAEMLKVMTVKSLVTLVSRPIKSGSHEKKGLTGSIFIKWDGMRFFRMKFGINFVDALASLTVCLLKSQSLSFYDRFKFQSCTISIKFRNEKAELFKAIHMEGKDVCLDFEHRYDEHIASVTNGNFSELADLEPYFDKTPVGQLLGLQVEMSMELHMRGLRKKHESRTYVFNCPGGPKELEPRKDTRLEEPWLKRMRMDEIHADLEIKVGPRLADTFKAHRCVLGVQSSVLDEALTKLTEPPYELNFAHVQAKPMSVFLSMMYEKQNQSQLSNDFQLIFDVLDLAEEFKVAGVTNQCVQHLVRLRSTDHSVSSVLSMHLKGCQLKILDLQFRALQIAFKKKDTMCSPEGQKTLAEFCQEHPIEAAKYSNGILGII